MESRRHTKARPFQVFERLERHPVIRLFRQVSIDRSLSLRLGQVGPEESGRLQFQSTKGSSVASLHGTYLLSIGETVDDLAQGRIEFFIHHPYAQTGITGASAHSIVSLSLGYLLRVVLVLPLTLQVGQLDFTPAHIVDHLLQRLQGRVHKYLAMANKRSSCSR